MSEFNIDDIWEARNGRRARIVSTTQLGNFPIRAIWQDGPTSGTGSTFTKDGRWTFNGANSANDLVRFVCHNGDASHVDPMPEAQPEKSDAEFEALRDANEPFSFQERVGNWMMACFGEKISADRIERGDRLLEEVFELLQSGAYPRERIAALEDYVYQRPAGEPSQEVGGVMVTLAAYSNAHEIDMSGWAEAELARVWGKIDQIRAKQAAKPTGSALPVKETNAFDAGDKPEGKADLQEALYSAYDEIAKLEDKLKTAVLVAYSRGAVQWVQNAYPHLAKRFAEENVRSDAFAKEASAAEDHGVEQVKRLGELMSEKSEAAELHPDFVVPGYEPLAAILQRALDQAQAGKGKERHANGRAFLDQPIMTIGRMVGVGYQTGQAMKKAQEAVGMLSRDQPDRAKAELLGAINYLAASILLIEESEA